MAIPRFAWGIDVGNRALKAIKLVRDGDSVRVDDFDVIEHETVLSNSGDNRESLIQAALKTFSERHPMKGGAVSVGVAGQSSFARFIKLPPVEEKKIPEIVRFEAIQQIPFPLDDVEWSYQLFRGGDSPDVEVGIFAMRKELINQHIKYFTDADLNVQVVQMNPLAVYNAMSFDQRVDGTTMIIDLGSENTDLIIADADTIWLRSIPIGGNNFTEALVKSFKLNFAKAEDLKRNAATSKYARQIFQAMRPVFADLVAEVQRSIGFYASVHRDSRIKKIVAVGGTFKLPGLQKYLQQNLQLPVERLDTLGGGAPPDAKQAATFQDNILSVVSAYGLALQAMGEGKITSSLLPARIRRERMWQEKTKFFAAAAALFLVGTGIGFGSIFLGEASFASAQPARDDIQRVSGEATRLDGLWTDIAGKGGPDRQRILNIRSLTDYRDQYAQILQDITRTLPVVPAPQELKAVARPQRKQIKIDSITNTYFGDLALVGGPLMRFAAEPTAPSPGYTVGVSAQTIVSAVPGAAGEPAAPMPDTSMMGTPDGSLAPVGDAAATGAPALTGRGFVVRIAGTTPYAEPAPLLSATVIKGLLELHKDKLPPGKTYAVERAELVHVGQVSANPARLQKLQADYDLAVRAKQTGEFAAGVGGGGGGGQFGGRMGGDDASTFGGRGGPMAGGFGGPGFGGPMPGGVDPGAAVGPQTKAFFDRQFPEEDVRQDHEFVVVAVLSLDPAPKPPAEGGAAPAEGGAAPPADGAAAAPAPAADPAPAQ